MRKALALTLALFVASLFTAVVSPGQQRDRPEISNGPKVKALVYHETTGFRHASIPYAIEHRDEAAQTAGIYGGVPGGHTVEADGLIKDVMAGLLDDMQAIQGEG